MERPHYSQRDPSGIQADEENILTMLASLSAHLRAAPYTAASIGVLLVAAYLCLVNLDYAALWHDEAPAAFRL